MLQKERKNQILAMLNKEGMVKIPDLAKAFGVSVITIRRDLDDLVRTGSVEKVYGGAVLAQQATAEPEAQRLFHARLAQNHRQKRLIGMAAAKLVKDGETIILNIGTTALEVAKHLEAYDDLTVLTNSLPILNQLADTKLNVYSLGGKLRSNELALHGSLAFKALNDFCVDKAFIGAGGITLKNGITDHNLDSAELCTAIASRSRQTILVTDSSKFGKDASVIVGALNCVDTIITDSGIPAEYAEGIRKAGIELIIADI